ncbi:hypothetical protein L6452_18675 [Arctium lappa]|uniref:Uncharacterized protein n=1 Tax=Arctium lappa TaxID=4217 RepID=A0ACB9C6Y1_ARCLA|nr:hypothetical protein L6452_18675 [Arctium lappa]
MVRRIAGDDTSEKRRVVITRSCCEVGSSHIHSFIVEVHGVVLLSQVRLTNFPFLLVFRLQRHSSLKICNILNQIRVLFIYTERFKFRFEIPLYIFLHPFSGLLLVFIGILCFEFGLNLDSFQNLDINVTVLNS